MKIKKSNDMREINSASDLKKAIKDLEEKNVIQGNELKRSFLKVYDSFRLVNIVKNTFKELKEIILPQNGILSSIIGFAFPSFSNKKPKEKENKENSGVFSDVLESLITSYILKKPTAIKIIGALALKYFISKKKS